MTPTNKNIQDLFKTYVAKSEGEEKFRKAHVVSTVDNNDEKLGPKDDQFVATTKTYARDASHHGYDAGGDEKVYSEEVNETDRDKAIAHYKADLPNILKDIRGKRKSHSDLRREYGGSWKRLANSTADEHGHNYNRDHLLAVGKQHMEDHASQINEMSSKMKMKLGLYGKKKKMEEEAELNEAPLKQAEDRHFEKQPPKMQAAINLELRKGKDYQDAVAAARRHFKEEVEELDEISKATMGRYINRAKDSIDMASYRQGNREARSDLGGTLKSLEKKLSKRHKGIETAVKKLTKEESEYLEKDLKKRKVNNDKAIKDMKKMGSPMKNPHFGEEVEQIDELSKKTLGSYVKKASGAERPKNPMDPKSVPITTIAAYQGDSETGHFGKRFNQRTYDKAERLRKNRETGIKRAVDKMTNEDAKPDYSEAGDAERIRKRQEGWQKTQDAEKAFEKRAKSIKHAHEFLQRYKGVKEEAGDDKLSTAIKKKLSDEGGASAFKPLKDAAMKMGVSLTPEMLKNISGVSQHNDGDYILDESALHTNCGTPECCGQCDTVDQIDEKKLTKAELAKREEVAAAMERENPGMDMSKKMAIATAQAKKVAEEIELGEAVNSDDAFDRLEKAGAKDVKTTSGGIRYTHGGKEYNLRHNMKRTGHRTVRTAELEQHLDRLQEEVEVVEEQFAPGKFKEAMIQRGLAALQEHIVGNE
jgi:hypothetical protein